jgi:hypothetical protein
MNDDLTRLGELVGRMPGQKSTGAARRVAEIWRDALGAEVASNSRPRSLRGGRLVASTSSAVWAQTLQLLSLDVVGRLNAALGERLIEEVVFRPAGWDPGGGASAPRALSGPPVADADRGEEGGVGQRPAPRRSLTAAEEEAVTEAAAAVGVDEIARALAAAMRASLQRTEADPRGD